VKFAGEERGKLFDTGQIRQVSLMFEDGGVQKISGEGCQ